MKRKLLVVGLDGLSCSLAQRLMEEGIWKNLKEFLLGSKPNSFQAEIPYLSPVNWTSFFTGKGPEEHGVFGFTEYSRAKQNLFFSDFSKVKVKTIFDILGEKGFFCKVLNLPHTYPARAIRGQLVSGFLALDLQRAVFPPMLYPLLKDLNYLLEANTIRALDNPALIFPEIEKSLLSRKKAFELLFSDLSWDIFVIVITELDRLFHFCYSYLEQENHPLHAQVISFLKKVDDFLGFIFTKYLQIKGGEKRIMLLADHGFTRLKKDVDLNGLFLEKGLLKYKRKPKSEWDLESVDKSSLVLALDAGRIYLNPFQQTRDLVLLAELKKMLLKLTYKDEPVIAKVWEKEEIYPGAFFEHTPDLICLPSLGFDLKGKFDQRPVFSHFGRSGAHLEKDVFFWDSCGFIPNKMRDIGTEILDFFKGKIVL